MQVYWRSLLHIEIILLISENTLMSFSHTYTIFSSTIYYLNNWSNRSFSYAGSTFSVCTELVQECEFWVTINHLSTQSRSSFDSCLPASTFTDQSQIEFFFLFSWIIPIPVKCALFMHLPVVHNLIILRIYL